MPDTPLNPDALEAAARATYEMRNPESWARTWDELEPKEREEEWVKPTRTSTLAYLAVAQPEVNSVEELDALPPESYVQGWDGFKHAKTHSGDWLLCVEHTRGAHNSESIELPASVLYRPEVNDA